MLSGEYITKYIGKVSTFQGATNGVCLVRTYAKETNFLPDVRGKIYCSTLVYAL